MSLNVQFFQVREPIEFENAVSEMAKAGVDALAVSDDPMLAGYNRVRARRSSLNGDQRAYGSVTASGLWIDNRPQPPARPVYV
jgi:hypothetical protein